MGLIGCGGRGRYVAKFMSESPNAQFVAVADVYGKSAAEGRGVGRNDARQFSDFRRLLELKDVDAVQVATPTTGTRRSPCSRAMQAKICTSRNPFPTTSWKAARSLSGASVTNASSFAGTQQRSAPHFAELAASSRAGGIGKVHLVRVWNFSNMLPNGIGRAPDSNPPSGSIGTCIWGRPKSAV